MDSTEKIWFGYVNDIIKRYQLATFSNHRQVISYHRNQLQMFMIVKFALCDFASTSDTQQNSRTKMCPDCKVVPTTVHNFPFGNLCAKGENLMLQWYIVTDPRLSLNLTFTTFDLRLPTRDAMKNLF